MAPCRWPLLWGLQVLLQVAALTAGQRPQERERPPRPAGWSPAPSSSWAPTAEPGAPGDSEGSAAALAFLRTGDAERLARANCSGAVSAGSPGPGPPPALRAALRAAPEALAHAANFLNMLFQTNDIREASVAEDVEWYQALVRSLAEGHPWVRRAVLALDAHPLAPKPRLMLQATKEDGQLLLQDVSSAAPSLGNLSWDNDWFNALKAQRVPELRKRVLSNDLRSLETPKWQRGDSYVGDPGHVRWSPPFLECREGQFLPTWVVTLSSAFYGLKPDLSPEFKGVVRVDVELRDVAIDQCSSGPGWFSDTHRCDLNSTQCVPQESSSFVLGRYLCRCKPGFYGAGGVASGAWAGVPGTDGVSRLRCRPCRPGCSTCEDDAPCLIQEDPALRAAVLSCQACCMLAIFLSMLVSYHFRRSKRIRTSGIILLETILFGSLLLYFPVFILYFKPSIFRCIVLRWVRMLGFAIVYGTITLKLYRVLKVFLSRTAQRAPYVSSGRVLRMLAPILLLVLWFLAAWTIGMLENAHKNIPLVIRAQTKRGLHFSICGHDCWDYMMVIAEMLFLLWGSFLCYATRAVPSAFHEPRYMGIALHNELMVSAAFHLVRFLIVPSLHPDWTLLLFFAHTHGTITMTLALLFIPKFLHTGSPLREEITAEVYEDELDMRRSGSCLNSSIASAWSEHSLDPDDIREELKKLYRQLEVHKTWRMASNNPHLGKKRSCRRSLARSILRAESSSRRSSAGERSGSASRRSSSAKRLVDGSGSSVRMRDESSRRRCSAPRKSRGSEGLPRGSQRGSRSPSPPLEAATPAALMEPEQSDSDSLDAAPLLCKSASAQNLAGHWRRPPGRAPALQKSHSVVAGAREAALLAARREQWHGSRHLSAPATRVPREAVTPQSPERDERGSQEDVAPLGDAKGHKHVTYGPVKSVSVDSAHPPRRVRVTVKKTPPPPPVRYQSLQRSGTLGDGPEPPAAPPAQAAQAEETAGDEAERASPAEGKGRLVTPSASSAHVCPWELVQEEILSKKQKAAEAAESGTAGDTAATSAVPKPPSHKSFRSLGLAIKALNRSKGKSILKGKSEGSLRKRGSSRRDKAGLAESSALSLGRSGQSLALQHNNNAAIPGETADWGDSGTGGQRDSLAPGTARGDKAAARPAEVAQPQQGDEDPAGLTEEEGRAESLEGTGRSLQEEQQRAEPVPSSVRGAERAQLGPPAIPAGRGALLRQEAIAAREDGGISESTGKALEKGSSQAEPERSPGRSWSGAGSAQGELSPAGDSSSKAGISPGRSGSEGDSQRSAGVEKPPELPRVTPEQGEGRRAEVCPWESREQGSSVRAEICPWDTEQEGQGAPKSDSVEQPGMGLAGKTPALLKPPWQRGGTAESKKNICPWEVEEEPRPKTEICPWEEAAAPSGMERRRQDTRGSDKGEEKVASRAAEKGKQPPAKLLPKSPSGKSQSSERAEICPWESQGSKTSDKAEICPWESQDLKSSEKSEICPWESQDLKSSEKSEICPREGVGPQLEKGTAPGKEKLQGKETSKALEKGSRERESICPWESQDSKSSDKAEICPWEAAAPQLEKGTAPGKERTPGQEETKALEKRSRERESICPWESPDTEQPLGKPQTGSSELPKESSGKSKSTESLKAEICPWESQDLKSSEKSEICPWEGAAPQLEKGTGPGKEKHQGEEASKALEKGSRERESICPWESPDTEQASAKPQTGSSEVPKSPSAKSQSSEKAEICPWEIECSDKSEICPWEGAEPQLLKGTSSIKKRLPGKEETKVLEKGSRDRVSVCPWDSPDTEQHPSKPQSGSSELPKSPSAKSQSSESLKAEICPWESQDLQSTDRAEICPWEGAEAEAEEGTGWRKGKLPGKEETKALERGSRERESICPWESPDTEQASAKPQTGSSEVPKSPSGKSQSSESLKAEICPWETQDLESSDKSEICPWEGAEPPSQQPKAKQGPTGGSRGDKRITRQAALASPDRALDSRDRVSVCPWDSPDMESLGKHQTGSSELPKSPSAKSQSSESLREEICPWESQDLESTDRAEICPWESQDSRSSDKAEMCLWDVVAHQLEKTATPDTKRQARKQGSKALQRGSRERESISPWDSPDPEKRPGRSQTGSSEVPKSPSAKSQSSESLREEICPWESQDLESTDRAEISSWVVTELQGKEASKVVERGSRERESICPWDSPDAEQASAKPQTGSSELPKSPSAKSQSSESLKAEICPWENQDLESSDKSEICPWEGAEAAAEKGTGSGKSKLPGKEETRALEKRSRERESICPWESPYTEQPLGKPQTGSSEVPKSPSGKSQSSQKAEICPWEIECSDKSEICPWEGAEPQLLKGTSSIKKRLPGKEETKVLEKGSRDRVSVCPWDSPDTEQNPSKPQSGSSEVPKSPSAKSQSSESLREEICPWESQDLESTDRAEICPWESQDSRSSDKAEMCLWDVVAHQLEKTATPDTKRQARKQGSKALQRGSRERESISPWDSPDPEKRPGRSQTRSSEVPKSPSAKSQSSESLREEICPWESQDLESTDRAEISSWVVTELQGKEASRVPERGSRERESICPWESPDAEQPLGKPQTGSSELPKSPSGKSQSSESLKAEICPWETQDLESSDKSEICPWEGAEPPSQQPKAKQGPTGGSRGDKRITRQAALASPDRALDSRDRVSVCPWDSPDMENLGKHQTGSSELPKSPSGKSQSSESLREEICPWESQDLESTDRAEICPWEGAEAEAEKGTGSGKSKLPGKEETRALEKRSRERESICPWDSPDPEKRPGRSQTGSSEVPKSPSGKSQSSESLREEICPWESQDLESTDRAEICPWESQDSRSSDKAEMCLWDVVAHQLEKTATPDMKRQARKQGSKALQRGSRERESISPWDSPDPEKRPGRSQTRSSEVPKSPSAKSQSSESLREEICPWENQDLESTDRAEISSWVVTELQGKEASRDPERGSRERESICPWESPDAEQAPAKPQTGSSEVPKSPSGKSQSSESLKAEICPWENQDLESSDKSEICPWEGAEPPSQQPKAKQGPTGGSRGDKRITRQAALASPDRALDSRDRVSVCPWDSPDMESLGKHQTGSSELPKSPSAKSQSSESLREEICPWESQDLESTDRAEICPWEGAEAEAEKGTGSGKSKLPGKEETRALEKRSRERESICPWDSPDTEQALAKPQTGSSEVPKSPSGKSQSSESLREEICPWESQDLESTDRAEICPWESQDSRSSDKAEMCLWDVVAHQLEKTATPDTKRQARKQGSKALQRGSRERESISPWDSPDPEKRPGRSQTGSSEVPKSPSAKSQSSESLREEICPWESQDLESTDRAEISSWVVTELQGKEASRVPERGSRERESISTWESPDTEQASAKPQTRISELPKSPSGKSQSSESLREEICPWESQDLESTDKAEICPWESQDLESTDRAEICPWEGAEAAAEKGTGSGKSKLPGKEETRALEKRSRERESICPWESPDTEKRPGRSQTGSSEVPKSPSAKSQSSESLREEICPWESQDLESTDRAEICPWEGAEAEAEEGTGWRKGKLPGKEETKALERGSRERESICPWESPDTEQPLGKPQTRSSEVPKSPSGKSQSSESLKAEICPWESQDLESSDKSEICPWEGAEPPSQQPKAKQGPTGGSRGDKRITRQAALASPDRALDSRDRVSVCPWDSPDMESLGKHQTGSSELPKSPSAKSQSSESLREEICPWENQDLESTDRAEICPWEGAEAAAEKGTGSGKSKLPGKEETKALEKRSRERESICPWESPDTEQPLGKPQTRSSEVPKSPSGKSQSSQKAEICPWEIECSDKSEICPWEGAEPQLLKGTSSIKKRLPGKEENKVLEKGSRDRVSVCPWDSPDTEQHPSKPQSGSSELPKSPSAKSQSSESLREEICPWESQDLESTDRAEICPWESQDSRSSDKAEMCLWDVVAHQLEKTATPDTKRQARKQGSKALQRGSRERESISPWDSPDPEKRPGRSQTGSSEVPKSPSGKSQSSESLREEICPWESQDLESTDRAEISSWVVTELQGKEASRVPERGSRERESICPWESPDAEQPLGKPQTGSSELPKSPSGKSQSSESLREEICPWENQDLESSDRAEISSWEGAEAAAEKGTGSGKSKLPGKEETKALEKRSRERESICPWESPDTEQPLGKPQTGSSEVPKSPSGKSQSPESLREEICPWESQDLESTDRAEICPWESQDSRSSDKAEMCLWDVVAHQLEKTATPDTKRQARKQGSKALQRGSRERESISPWDSPDPEKRPGRSQTGSSEVPKSPSAKSQSSESLREEICPWESQDLESTDRAEISSWVVTELQGKEASRVPERGSRERESISTWESPDTEQASAKPQTGSSELPKSPSAKSQSSEKAEICPWEVGSSDKSEICPWEGAEPQLLKGTGPGKEKLPAGEASKALEKGSRDQESICPWESPDTQEPSTKCHSTESRKSEICPWEGAEPLGSEGEISQPGVQPQGAHRASPAASPSPVEKCRGKSHREAEHKPLCRLQPSIRHPGLGSSSSPSPSPGLAEVCPWQAAAAPAAPGKPSRDSRKSSEVCPWEEESTEPSPSPRDEGGV